jgi:hypothetical protein
LLNENTIKMLLCDRFKLHVDLAAVAGLEDLNFHTVCTSGNVNVFHDGRSVCLVSRIDEHSNTRGLRQNLAQEFKLLRRELGVKKVYTGQVAAGARKAADQPELDWILSREKDNWDRRRHRLCSKSSAKTSARDDYINISMRKVGRQNRQSIHSIFSPKIFDRYGPTFRVAALLKTTTEPAQAIAHGFNRSGINKSYYWQVSLLSVSSNRQRRRTAKQSYELASPHGASQL